MTLRNLVGKKILPTRTGNMYTNAPRGDDVQHGGEDEKKGLYMYIASSLSW